MLGEREFMLCVRGTPAAEASASAAPFLGVGGLNLDARESNNGDVKVWGNPRCRGVGIRSSLFGGGWLEAGRERSRE